MLHDVKSFDRNEKARLRALRALNLLDAPPLAEFNSLVELAAELLDVPIVLLTLVDQDRQWVAAGYGLDTREMPRSVAFCNHTIAGDVAFEVNDATADSRFAHNPLVTNAPNIRAYCGIPIFASDPDGGRNAIGAFCGIDTVPRRFTPRQRAAISHFARLAEALIAARGAAQEAIRLAERVHSSAEVLRQREKTLNQAERMAKLGSWRYEIQSGQVTWSEGVYAIHELDSANTPDLSRALDHYPPYERGRVLDFLENAVKGGKAYDFEADFDTATGTRLRVRALGEAELVEGEPVAVVGVFQDITRAHELEQELRRTALTDAVTCIANRAAFDTSLDAAMREARVGERSFWLVLIDVDHFKAINDTHGHLAGDGVLRSIARRLHAPYLGGTVAARTGGDEFALIVDSAATSIDIDQVIDRLLAHLAQAVPHEDGAIAVSCTIGYARFDAETASAGQILAAADGSLYEAKRDRRGTARRAAGG